MSNIILTKSKGYSNQDISNTVEEGLNTLQIADNFEHNSIIIKPNLCYYWDYSTGQTTDPRVVGSIINWIRQRDDKVKIYIGEADASAMKTKYSFKMLGYQKLAQEKRVELLNLSKGEIIKKEVEVEKKNITLPINKILLESDLIINVPTLKTHREIGFTCAMKNMFGSIAKPWKYSYHKKLSETILAINKIIQSDIVIVDGIIASGKTPKKMGIIITGEDAYSIDVVVADLLGYGASNVPYLRMAKKEKIGKIKDIKINEKSAQIRNIKNDFPKPNYFLEKMIWKSELLALKIYAKIVGDVIPPVLDGI
jgi:uncharacterized protein (DUF362 family)